MSKIKQLAEQTAETESVPMDPILRSQEEWIEFLKDAHEELSKIRQELADELKKDLH